VIPVTVTGNFPEKLGELNQVLGIYAALSRRTPESALASKANIVVLGINFKGQAKQPGLHQRLAATAPAMGAITQARIADDWNIGDDDDRSFSWGLMKARQTLGSAKSGAFRILTGDQGGVQYLAGVQAGLTQVRGRRKGQITFGSRSKTATKAVRVSRAAARAAGGVVLNVQALAAAYAVTRREKSRLATAAQFLPKRYRTLRIKRPDLEYNGAGVLGVSSTDAAMMHRHERVAIANRKGRELGAFELVVREGSASLRMTGFLGVHTPSQQAAVNASLQMALDDTLIYIADRNRKNLETAMRAALRV
jgi:hypothetical protein